MSNLLSDKCISVTDLRTNTKKCLDDLQTNEKYIFNEFEL